MTELRHGNTQEPAGPHLPVSLVETKFFAGLFGIWDILVPQSHPPIARHPGRVAAAARRPVRSGDGISILRLPDDRARLPQLQFPSDVYQSRQPMRPHCPVEVAR